MNLRYLRVIMGNMLPSPPIRIGLFVTLLVANGAIGDDLGGSSSSLRWQRLRLSADRPDDLEIDLPHLAVNVRFAEFVYGALQSRRVAVVVAKSDGNDEPIVYVDTQRARSINRHDRIERSGPIYCVALAAEQVIGSDVAHFPRNVLLEIAGDHVRLATETTCEHSLQLSDGRRWQARQIDGNANGMYADPQDLIEVDVNGDRRFDPFSETFPFRPVMRIQGIRYIARGDPFGTQLAVEPSTATGRLQLAARPQGDHDRLVSVHMTIAGKDGSIFSVSGTESATDIPVGFYAPNGLILSIDAERDGRTWEYIFSRYGSIRDADCFEIGPGETTTYDPIGQVTISAEVKYSATGDMSTCRVQPRLYTGSGLLINRCRVGDGSWKMQPECAIALLDEAGNTVAHSTSGFA